MRVDIWGYIGIYWGYNPLILIFDPNFQRNIQVHPSGNTPSLRSFHLPIMDHHGPRFGLRRNDLTLQENEHSNGTSSFYLGKTSSNSPVFLFNCHVIVTGRVKQGNNFNFNPKVQVHAQVVIHKVVELLATLLGPPSMGARSGSVCCVIHRSKIYKKNRVYLLLPGTGTLNRYGENLPTLIPFRLLKNMSYMEYQYLGLFDKKHRTSIPKVMVKFHSYLEFASWMRMEKASKDILPNGGFWWRWIPWYNP